MYITIVVRYMCVYIMTNFYADFRYATNGEVILLGADDGYVIMMSGKASDAFKMLCFTCKSNLIVLKFISSE